MASLISFYVVYTIKDDTGKKSTLRIAFPADANFGTLMSFAESTAQLIDPLIKGQVVDIGISASVNLPSSGLKLAPVAGADVEEGGYFGFLSASGHSAGFTLPTFDEAFVVASSDLIDLTDTDVDAFVDRIIAGVTELLVNVSPSDSHGSDLEAVETAKESFRSTRRS